MYYDVLSVSKCKLLSSILYVHTNGELFNSLIKRLTVRVFIQNCNKCPVHDYVKLL